MRPLLLKGHERPLTRAKFNREGDLLFTTAMDKSPSVWRSSNGERIGTYKGHNGAVRDISVTWDTTRVITGSADNSAILWNAETGEKLHQWHFKSPVRSVAFSPGDAYIAIATAKLMGQASNVFIFAHNKSSNEQTEEPVKVLEGHEGTITRVLWHASAEILLTASEDKTIRKWDVEAGEEIQCVTAHKNDIKDCQFSADYAMVITASKDHTAKLWSFHDFSLLRTYTVDHPVNSAAVSPIFSHILLGGGQEASQVTTTGDRQGKFEGKIFHLVYEEELGRVKGHFGPINTVAFSPDGKQYVSGGEDGFVRLHDFDPDYFTKGQEGLV
ncbi:Translation initiation factor eIF3, subunit I [Chondrus crispus]|uniref:Eukaryotic translation initiation factor 3 subunit I n=1 Tax=Chondrus crispus TaxID=2769 RepID=R7QKL4_CHOCR|nr:Translation initiation factor eIF3, subunit I [Chondrus crispus]CDF38619.1 Translation initiation factor eIF3, subunit I [Chondrus crispus]|eukprot:XP_005718524.1 Translation initiation factor eIF3, subunit I [Chondrus crispus]